MIFGIANHVTLVIQGKKTQTRRSSDRYEVGRLYSIQPSRTSKGIKEGKIKIVDKKREVYPYTIDVGDAKAEGDYEPEEFEKLYNKLHPFWHQRYAYTFRFVEVVE